MNINVHYYGSMYVCVDINEKYFDVFIHDVKISI